MNEVDTLTRIAQTLAGPGGTMFVIVLVGYAIATKKLVPGWIFDQCVDDAKTLRTDLAARIARSESDLEQLRRDRMGQRD